MERDENIEKAVEELKFPKTYLFVKPKVGGEVEECEEWVEWEFSDTDWMDSKVFRRRLAIEKGLPENATWEDINRVISEVPGKGK